MSADPERSLIGDDEHGWSDDGIFNIEVVAMPNASASPKRKSLRSGRESGSGPCWKTLWWTMIGHAHYDDSSLTENTRAAYPIEHIPSARIPGVGGHPDVIIFLTADAFGVLPPIAKLTPEQAMYHFLSGYTSKLAGTERGSPNRKPPSLPVLALPFYLAPPVSMQRCSGKKSTATGFASIW